MNDSLIEEAKARGKREGKLQGLATGRLARARLRAKNAVLVERFKRRTGQFRRLRAAAAAVVRQPDTEALENLRSVLREEVRR